MSVKGRGPDRASGLDDGDRLRFSLVVVGYCVLRISSNVSSLMGGGYYASCSSFSESCIFSTPVVILALIHYVFRGRVLVVKGTYVGPRWSLYDFDLSY